MKTQVFDNGGVTLDRFTIIIGGDMFGASETSHITRIGEDAHEFCKDDRHADRRN